MDTERDFDIALLEIQEENDRLIDEWRKQKLGARLTNGIDTEFLQQDQILSASADSANRP